MGFKQRRWEHSMAAKMSCEEGWVFECKLCQFRGETYTHGSEITEGAEILECSDGNWRTRINVFVTVGP
jgi:hypothetical protein